MARKKKHPEHVNHERWLISYADFITLLFAFFVVMFAVSQVDSKKVGRFTESFAKAIGVDTFPEPGAGLLPGGTQRARKDEPSNVQKLALAQELEDLRDQLDELRKRAELPKALQVLQRRNELVIRLSENLFFDAGDDRLKDPSAKAMRTLAGQLGSRNVDIRIEGHTDNQPIRTARFRSNWDLSTSRATAVVAILADSLIAPNRLSAAGYGEYHPIAPNETAEGRRQNRRVDIVISVRTEPEKSDGLDKLDKNAKGAKSAKSDTADAGETSEKDDAGEASEGAEKHEPAEKHDAPTEKHDAPAKHGAPGKHE
jgi:chemotaxis protein MotB